MKRLPASALLILLTAPLLAADNPNIKITPIPTTNPAPATKPAATRPATRPSTQPAATNPDLVQDGPGVYRITAGPNGRFRTTVRAKSREDAITIGLKTVAKQAMDYDENVNITEITVTRIAP